MAIEIKTYGDLKKLVSAIKNKQTKDSILSKGKEIALNQLLGFIPGASNVADIAGLVKSAFKKPDTQKTDTWLDKLDIDDQVSAIVDDTVENGYLQSLVKNIQTKNDEEELPDDFDTTKDLQVYLKNKYRGRSVTNQMNENKKIIRYLLEQDEEDTPKTFEENPMEFILDKYISLNNIMTELMTDSYREYLDAVFIVSPKPTSFKIILHNGQYFYLTYMGPAYEASVAGKNYYLSNVGEKERCMLAISKLLRGGNPLKTKGPEGAEQGAEAGEEGGESSGTLSATGGAGEETGGAGEEAGGEESLTESVSFLRNLLIEYVVESKSSKLVDAIVSGMGGKKNSKRGLHVRGDFGSEEEVKTKLSSLLGDLNFGEGDYEITTIYPGDTDNGAKSSVYKTYEITVNEEIPPFKKGERVYVVNREKGVGSESYSLKPQQLGVPSEPITKEELVDAAIKGINNNNTLNEYQKKYLSQILVGKVSLSDEEKKELRKDGNFINQVEKNFGEILLATRMLGSKKTTKVQFTGKMTESLVDFFVDTRGKRVSVSVKAGSSKGNTIKAKDLIDLMDKEGVNEELMNILEIIAHSSVKQMPVDVANLNPESKEIESKKTQYDNSKSPKDLYYLEKAVIDYVNEKYSTEIQEEVSQAIGSMLYAKTKIKQDLTPQFIVKKSGSLRFKLRSKNSQNRFIDRVGFDVK